MNAFTFRGLVYAANCTVAALAALYIAFSFGLPNPWWAALTVFIVSQPMAAVSGAVVARSLYRVGGTVLGGLASLVILPAFADTPPLLIAALAAWVALCVYVSLLDRTPRGYAFMLAGYTVALVGLPLAGDPTTLFDNMLLRVEEIAIGAVCAAVAHSVVLPLSIRALAEAKISGSFKDARSWIAGALSMTMTPATEQASRRRLAQDLTELHLLATNLKFDMVAGSAEMRVVWALEERLVGVLPLLSGIEDRLGAMMREGALPPTLASHVNDVRQWIEQSTGSDGKRLAALLDAGRQALPTAGTVPPWMEALTASVVLRLAELAQAWNDALHLSHVIRERHHRLDAHTQTLIDGHSPRVLHVDHGLAAFSGLAVALAVVLASAVPVVTGWQQGAVAVGIAAAGSSVFAFLDDPRPMQKLFITWTLVAVPVAALYVFAILPAIDGFGALALALTPLYFVTALYLATPTHWLRALGFALVGQTLISLQPAQRPDFIVFTTIAIASIAGAVVALVVTSLVRVVGAQTSSRRILRAGWRDLASLAEGRKAGRRALASRMLDRVGLLVPRLARATGDERLRLADALNDLRLGVNVDDLQQVKTASLGAALPAVDRVLGAVAAHYRAQVRVGHAAADVHLVRDIDSAIDAMSRLDRGETRTRGLAAAMGLRRSLLPDAPPYEAMEQAA